MAMSGGQTNCDVPPLHFHKNKGPHKTSLKMHMHYTDTSTPGCACCGKRFGMVQTRVAVTARTHRTLYMYDIEAGLHFETESPMNIAVADEEGNVDSGTLLCLPAGTLFLVPGCKR
jgi:hypothetical protein